MTLATLLGAEVSRRLALLAGALVLFPKPVAADHDGT